MSLLRRTDDGGASFWCPGCKEMHHVNTTWQIDFATNTLGPSVLVANGHFAPGFVPGSDCWCTYNEKHPDNPSHFTCLSCHSFVRDGMIEFLSDCSHKLAGQTVPLTEMEAA